MKIQSALFLALLTVVLCSCESKPVTNTVASKPVSAASPTPVATVSKPKDGDYNGKGVVTKINPDLGSVELDHEEIKDLMPAMLMEFFVSDKKLLDGLKIGDKVEFVVRYKDPTETIVSIKKAQ